MIPGSGGCSAGGPEQPIGYFVSFANGFDALSLLDVFLDFDFDPRFQLRIGRFKTPFTYEFFVEPIQGLVVPERSIFFNNFGQNRDLGVMAYGRLFDGLRSTMPRASSTAPATATSPSRMRRRSPRS